MPRRRLMALGLRWSVRDPADLARGGVIGPHERLPWGLTAGFGAQHVVAMFGSTFVWPLIMGLNAQLALMMSGVATVLFLLIVQGKVPSYLGTSAAFAGGVAAIRAQGGDSPTVTGAIMVAGIVLALSGVLIHWVGAHRVHALFPPVVTGAIVMLIGFNLAPVVSRIYWPQDQVVALATMAFTVLLTVASRGLLGRMAVLLALVFGTALSWLLDTTTGPITSVLPRAAQATEHLRWNTDAIGAAPWFGLPTRTFVAADGQETVGWHLPTLSLAATLLVLPAVVALIAENAGHVKAVAEMVDEDLDPMMGRAIAGDGVGTAVAAFVGGSPTTTYAQNIGVMAATRVYSSAAYYIAALIAIGFGLSPKVGALVASIPGGVLGGITVVLYGTIGLLGAKIWQHYDVDLADPVNLVPIAAGLIIGIGNVELRLGPTFTLNGISLGTIVVIGAYHLAKAIAPTPDPGGPAPGGTAISLGEHVYGSERPGRVPTSEVAKGDVGDSP